MKKKYSTFTTYQSDKDGQWRWREKINGRITSGSEEGDGYNRKSGAEKSLARLIERIKTGAYKIA